MAHPSKPFPELSIGELVDQADPLDPQPADSADEAEAEAEDGEVEASGLGSFADLGGEEAPRAGGVTDLLRKAVVAGLGAVFMTEEGIRALVKDLKLPKDVMGFVLGQAERSKTELFRIVGEEMRRFFESAALRRELSRLVSDMTIEVKAEIRLRPDGQMPDIKLASTSARRRKRRRKKS